MVLESILIHNNFIKVLYKTWSEVYRVVHQVVLVHYLLMTSN